MMALSQPHQLPIAGGGRGGPQNCFAANLSSLVSTTSVSKEASFAPPVHNLKPRARTTTQSLGSTTIATTQKKVRRKIAGRTPDAIPNFLCFATVAPSTQAFNPRRKLQKGQEELDVAGEAFLHARLSCFIFFNLQLADEESASLSL